MMPRGSKQKPTPKPDDPAESKRFIDMAREVEADESDDALDRAFKKVVGSKTKSQSPKNI
jgi:hypothetical protein